MKRVVETAVWVLRQGALIKHRDALGNEGTMVKTRRLLTRQWVRGSPILSVPSRAEKSRRSRNNLQKNLRNLIKGSGC